MAKAIDWSKIAVASEGGPSVFSTSFDCIICMHSVPINTVRQPRIPICQDCRKVLRELVAERQTREER